VSERSCARCGESIEHVRADARYCGSYCRFTAWIERHPEAREKRLATTRKLRSSRSTRKARKGCERGTRIYLTHADLSELSALTATGSARIVRKVNDAMLRIERAERP
jgi:hypothetical protein